MKNSVIYKKICYYCSCGDIMKRKSLILMLGIAILFIGISVDAKELSILASNTSCTGYFGSASDGKSLMGIIVRIFDMIKISVPIILLIMTTLDFSKVVFTDSKDAMEKAKKNFTKRAIIAVVIFFIPVLLEIVLNYVNDASIKECLNNFN